MQNFRLDEGSYILALLKEEISECAEHLFFLGILRILQIADYISVNMFSLNLSRMIAV